MPARGAAPGWVVPFADRTRLVELPPKMLRSAWDVSWHFRFRCDDLAPPHLVNSMGPGIAVVLVTIHTFTGLARTRRSQRRVQSGPAVVLVFAGFAVDLTRRLRPRSPPDAPEPRGTGVRRGSGRGVSPRSCGPRT